MNVKNLITSIGVSALLLGIGMNTHQAWNDHGIKEATLSQFVEGQSDPGSPTLRCTERGGKEARELVLMREVCIKELSGNISISIALSLVQILNSGGSISAEVGGNIVLGNRCSCLAPPKGYSGVRGCNYSWETNCI